MITSPETTQHDFYREFLMGRGKINPPEFGVNMPKDAFMDQMVEDFAIIYRDTWTLDEMLLHPREAAKFCDDVRRKHGFYDVPDDIILRSIMNRRKHG